VLMPLDAFEAVVAHLSERVEGEADHA